MGYKKKEMEAKKLPFLKLFTILLILWGFLVSWFAIGFYYVDVIPWSMEYGVRKLTVWDHLMFATWALKGILWIASGLVFTITSYIFKRP